MIADRVIAAIAASKRIPAASINLESDLRDLGVDSLDVVDIVFRLEEEFGVRLDESTNLHAETVADAVALFERALAGQSPPPGIASARA